MNAQPAPPQRPANRGRRRSSLRPPEPRPYLHLGGLLSIAAGDVPAAQIAALLGTSAQAVYRWLRGASLPHLDQADDLCAYCMATPAQESRVLAEIERITAARAAEHAASIAARKAAQISSHAARLERHREIDAARADKRRDYDRRKREILAGAMAAAKPQGRIKRRPVKGPAQPQAKGPRARTARRAALREVSDER